MEAEEEEDEEARELDEEEEEEDTKVEEDEDEAHLATANEKNGRVNSKSSCLLHVYLLICNVLPAKHFCPINHSQEFSS